MKRISNMTVKWLLAAGLSVLFCMTALAATIETSWSGLSLTADGYASWNAPSLPAGSTALQVEQYEIELARKNKGNWNDSYKRVKSDTEGYEFYFSSTGIYKFRVRAKFYGGDYSSWSPMSGEVTVTSDHVSHGGHWDDDVDPYQDYLDNIGRWGNYGPGYNPNGTPISGSNNGAPGGNPYGPGYNPNLSGGFGNAYPGYPNTNNYNNYAPSATPNTGWIKGDHGWWYKHADGSYPTNSWQHIDGCWYFFDSYGYMKTGWVYWNNYWYLCLPDGRMATGWQNVNEKWYYLNESGIMQTGWQIIDGKTYFLDATGARVSNGYAPSGHYFDENGVLVR